MSLSLRSSSNNFHDDERVTRARRNTKLNRFLSFNENQSASRETRRRSFQKTANLIELLEEDEDDLDDYEVLSYECNSCSKNFASEFGLNHHMNIHHPNQSVLCSMCNLTFRSHRSLKTHQQRRHSSHQTIKHIYKTDRNEILPDYSFISSYLVLAFSSRQFPLVAKIACEQKSLPLGNFASRLYQCHFCRISFPCSRTLKFHLLDQHEHFEFELCDNLLNEMILQIEENCRTVDNQQENIEQDDFQSIEIHLAKQASSFGLRNKQLTNKYRLLKIEQNRLIYPDCQHQQRTCANLCLNQLSSYNDFIQNYNYSILPLPKGNPFAQGSIISHSTISTIKSTPNSNSITTQDSNNGRQKRRNISQTNFSSSNGSKRKSLTNSSTNNKNHRNSTIQTEPNHSNKIEETKIKTENSLIFSPTNVQKKTSTKDNSTRSSSNSSNSPKSSPSNLSNGNSLNTKQRSTKRNSTTNGNFPSKRLRTRAQTNKNHFQSSLKSSVIEIEDENGLDQENGDQIDSDANDHSDSNDHVDDDQTSDDVIPMSNQHPLRTPKSRKSSDESVEYIQILDDDEPSLNNIENVKSKSKRNQQNRNCSRSISKVQKLIPSTNKNHSKTTIAAHHRRKTTNHQIKKKSSKDEENIRVRCKVCGVILKGRRRFSKHVIEMHGHLLIKRPTVNEQTSHQTAVIR